MTLTVKTERDLSTRFKQCAADHGLRLHRIHVLSATKGGSFQSSVVLDCRCGQRWLLRVLQGDVVAVDGSVLDELSRGREGQATAPPGFPGAADEPENEDAAAGATRPAPAAGRTGRRSR